MKFNTWTSGLLAAVSALAIMGCGGLSDKNPPSVPINMTKGIITQANAMKLMGDIFTRNDIYENYGLGMGKPNSHLKFSRSLANAPGSNSLIHYTCESGSVLEDTDIEYDTIHGIPFLRHFDGTIVHKNCNHGDIISQSGRWSGLFNHKMFESQVVDINHTDYSRTMENEQTDIHSFHISSQSKFGKDEHGVEYHIGTSGYMTIDSLTLISNGHTLGLADYRIDANNTSALTTYSTNGLLYSDHANGWLTLETTQVFMIPTKPVMHHCATSGQWVLKGGSGTMTAVATASESLEVSVDGVHVGSISCADRDDD